MIPAQPGWKARFEETSKTGHKYNTYLDIHAWDSDGTPLVIPDVGGRRLTPATNFANYLDVCEDANPPVVAVAPADGWIVRYAPQDGHSSWTEPVIAWAVRADGSVKALTTDVHGYIGEVECEDGTCGVYQDRS